MNLIGGYFPSPEHSTFLTIVKVVFGIVLVAGSPKLALGLLEKNKHDQDSENWPHSVATITKSEVATKRLVRGIAYSPEVAYTFEVEGRRITGHRIALSSSDSQSHADAAKVVKKYPNGSQHAVFYNPSDYEDCVLEKGTGWFHYAVLVVPIVFLLGGGAMAWGNFCELRRRQRASAT